MKPDIKQRWLSALRSGKYVHGATYLKILREDGQICHCVMGVLCEIHAEETAQEWKTHIVGDVPVFSYLSSAGTIPFDVQRWSGISDSVPFFEEETDTGIRSTSLSYLNDSSMSYDTAVDAIEKEL